MSLTGDLTEPAGSVVALRPGRARALSARIDHWALLVALLAGALVAVGIRLGWRGVDLPAQLYRVDLVRHHGFVAWDAQWFGGQWLLSYSVLFPVVAAAVGVASVSIASAIVAALAFDRLVVWHFGRQARAASVAFAVSVVVQTSIGQLTFLSGEALALCCAVAMARRWWVPAAILALAATLTSPLAGAFAVLGAAAWLLSRWQIRPLAGGGVAALAQRVIAGRPRDWKGVVAVVAGVGVPVAAVGLLFPGEGMMPYPSIDWVWELVVAGILFLVTSRRDRVVRTGLILFAVAATLCEAVSSPVGGNVGRIEDCLAFPLAVACCWPARRRIVLAVVGVPLILSQWSPAWAAMTTNASQAWTHRGYYQPVDAWLRQAGGPAGRVEVVPTADHWEAAYIAPVVPLARGWERQTDRSDNAVFYVAGALNATSYVQWLEDNGVRFVALSAGPLDSAGVAEGRLVAAGVPGLRQVWHNANWRVYAVTGSTGIVSGPATLTKNGTTMLLDVRRAGPLLVRVRDNPGWQVVAGQATVSVGSGRWIALDVAAPGLVELHLGVPFPG